MSPCLPALIGPLLGVSPPLRLERNLLLDMVCQRCVSKILKQNRLGGGFYVLFVEYLLPVGAEVGPVVIGEYSEFLELIFSISNEDSIH